MKLLSIHSKTTEINVYAMIVDVYSYSIKCPGALMINIAQIV
jgi:hypothetical protein